MTRLKKQPRARGIRNGRLRFKYMFNLYSSRSIIYHIVSLLKAAYYCVANLSLSKPHQTPPTPLIPSEIVRVLGLCSVLIVDSCEEIFCDGGDGMKERAYLQSLRGDGDTKTRKEKNQLNRNNFDIVHFDAQRNYPTGIMHVTQL